LMPYPVRTSARGLRVIVFFTLTLALSGGRRDA
jgi:hypothetical protein